MQLSALRYFLETARLGSIRQASEKLNVAPSAISRQIAKLEDTYGMALFERSATGVHVTEAGSVFLKQARTTLRDFERLQSEIDELQELRRGLVRIVTVWGTAASVVYPAIADFTQIYPGITFDVKVLSGAQIVPSIVDQECDIAIAFEPMPHQDVEEVQSIHDPIVAVMLPDHPLASRDRLSLGEIAQYPVAVPDQSIMTRRLLDMALVEEGVTLQIKIVFNGIGLVAACARTGHLVSFAPSQVVRSDVEAGLLKAVPIKHSSLPQTRFVLCRHRTRPMTIPARTFMKTLQSRFNAYNDELHGTKLS